MILEGPAFFDLALTLECGQIFRWNRVPGDEGWYEIIAGSHAFRIRQTRPGNALKGIGSEIEVSGKPIPDANWVQHFLAWDDDYDAIRSDLARCSFLSHLWDRYPGLRVIHQDPWEATLSFLLSSCSNIPRITKNLQDLAKKYGKTISTPWGSRSLLPRPTELTKGSEQAFRDLALGYRAKFLDQIVENLTVDSNFFTDLYDAPLETVMEDLQALPGIGHKVASCIALFGLDHHDAFPVDTWMLKIIQNVYFTCFQDHCADHPLNARWAAVWAGAYFGAHAGIAQQYLYYYARTEKISIPGSRKANSKTRGKKIIHRK